MPMPAVNEDDLSLHRPLADINVTPLVDVMLVLLIIFMVTAPMLAAGLHLNLPPARSAQPVSPKEPVIVSVTKEGKILLGRDEISREALVGAVRDRLGDDASRAVYIQADRDTVYGNVVSIIDLLTASGLSKVVMLVDRSKDAPAPVAHQHAGEPAHHHPPADQQ